MSQSLAKIYIHLVFSTKGRTDTIWRRYSIIMGVRPYRWAEPRTMYIFCSCWANRWTSRKSSGRSNRARPDGSMRKRVTRSGISHGRMVMGHLAWATVMWMPWWHISKARRIITRRWRSRMSCGGFASCTTCRWMNVTRGINAPESYEPPTGAVIKRFPFWIGASPYVRLLAPYRGVIFVNTTINRGKPLS